MKRNLIVLLAIVWVVAGATGCQTLKNKMPGASKAAEPTLYSQVPAEMQAPVDEAMVAMQTAKDELAVAKERVALAKLKKERANLEKKYADQNEDLAETTVEKAEATIELKRMEAIDNAGLGDKAANIREIADLKTDELGLESDIIDTRAKMATLALKIKELTAQIEEMAASIDSN